jgi:group I intron endonuclease
MMHEDLVDVIYSPMGCIYILHCKITQKLYIGKSIQPTKRWTQHLCQAKKGSKYPIHRALLEYGYDAFHFDLLEICRVEDLNKAEVRWIKDLNTQVPNGYNLDAGGNGAKSTILARILMGQNCMNRNQAIVHRSRTQEEKDSISAAHKGKPLTTGHKDKVSKSNRLYWSKLSSEEKEEKIEHLRPYHELMAFQKRQRICLGLVDVVEGFELCAKQALASVRKRGARKFRELVL